MEKDFILNAGISLIAMDDACAFIEKAVTLREKIYVCVCPVSTVMACQRSERVLTSVNAADLATPDGMPVVWILRMRGHTGVRRVYGPDLMRRMCALSQTKPYTHFFYGSTTGVVDTLKEKLRVTYPGVRVTGSLCPPFGELSEKEDEEIVARINRADPDIVWVGLGSPKQDVWMHEHRERINAPVLIGIGAAFDFLAGVKPQAPRWMMKIGFEWFFRLVTEPKRLWKRYLIECPLFVYLILREHVAGPVRKRPASG